MSYSAIWFLIIFRFGSVPMASEQACMAAAASQLKNQGTYCVNAQTGEVKRP